MRSYRVVILLLVVVFCSLSGQGRFAWAEDPPLPALTGRVIDRADILSSATEATLSAKIETYEKASTGQIVIVTLPDLMGRPIEDWGLMLGRGWGIGQSGKDNGIIFLVAPNDRELRIEVGYGLEGDFPDATANRIIQSDVIPRFKQGDLEGGVTIGLDGILAALAGTYQPASQSVSTEAGVNWSEVSENLVPFVAFGCFILLGLLMSVRRRFDKKKKRYVWYIQQSTGGSGYSGSFGSSSRSSGGGFSGGGGSFGGGGASGKW